MGKTTRVIPTMAEFQALAAKLKDAKAKASAAWNAKSEAQRIRNEAIEHLPEQIAFKRLDDEWYKLQDIEDELRDQWEKACEAIGGFDE